MRLLAIDPGPVQSAYIFLEYSTPEDISVHDFGILQNEQVLERIGTQSVVIEKATPYGAVVGNELFETIYWTGRFAERGHYKVVPVWRMARKAVVAQLCGLAQANDSRVRQALIDRWGGKECTKKGGMLYKVKDDIWQALALGVAWIEQIGSLED
jgi:hypothetical protein